MASKYLTAKTGTEAEIIDGDLSLAVGEFAVATDTKKAFVATGDNEVVEITGQIRIVDSGVDELKHDVKAIRKELDELSRKNSLGESVSKLKAEMETISKAVSEKFGYVKKTDKGLEFYDRIGGKILAGPLATTPPAITVQTKVSAEPEPDIPTGINWAGKSKTDSNGKMYVYFAKPFPSDGYELIVEGAEVESRNEVFFSVTGNPDTEFSWIATMEG